MPGEKVQYGVSDVGELPDKYKLKPYDVTSADTLPELPPSPFFDFILGQDKQENSASSQTPEQVFFYDDSLLLTSLGREIQEELIISPAEGIDPLKTAYETALARRDAALSEAFWRDTDAFWDNYRTENLTEEERELYVGESMSQMLHLRTPEELRPDIDKGEDELQPQKIGYRGEPIFEAEPVDNLTNVVTIKKKTELVFAAD